MSHKPLARLAQYLCVLCLFVSSAAAARAAERDAQPYPSSAPGVRITIYPILIQAPIFGATIELPPLPSGPGSGEGGPFSGSTEAGVNSAYGAGLSVEGRRWFAEANGTWAGLGAEHLPRLSVDSDVFFLDGRAGVRLFDSVSATAGFRRVSVDLRASMTLPAIDRTLEASVKPVLWDPLVGVDWRGHLGHRWTLNLSAEGGGFGVGTDVDVSADALANWHVARHVDLRLGYRMLYYKLTVADVPVGAFQRTLVSKQTLHGPAFGLGIVF
jgi:hypothetical protein